jgi:hypothetical protein
MFLNISEQRFPDVWLSRFPTKKRGVQNPALKAPESLGVPTVPPFPRFFSQTHLGNGANRAR